MRCWWKDLHNLVLYINCNLTEWANRHWNWLYLYFPAYWMEAVIINFLVQQRSATFKLKIIKKKELKMNTIWLWGEHKRDSQCRCNTRNIYKSCFLNIQLISILLTLVIMLNRDSQGCHKNHIKHTLRSVISKNYFNSHRKWLACLSMACSDTAWLTAAN